MLRAMPYKPTTVSGPAGWWQRIKRWGKRMLGAHPHPAGRHRKTSLLEWQAYYHLDPFGGERGDLQAALVKHAIVNTMGRGQDADTLELEDCIPRFGESERDRKRRERDKNREATEKIKRIFGR